MTVDELEHALRSLNWKGSDFCRKTGVSRATISRWVRGITDVPDWVPAYLAAMAAIKTLYEQTVMPEAAADVGRDESDQEDGMP